jgi:hypothetical protein
MTATPLLELGDIGHVVVEPQFLIFGERKLKKVQNHVRS